VNALFAAENANNADAAVALFAPDAVVTLPTGMFQGTDAIRSWQRELAEGRFRANVGPAQVSGATVTVTGSVELDLFRDLGLPVMESTWAITVEAGRIRTFTFDFTPEAAARFQAAIAAAQSAPPADPEAVVNALFTAENANDPEAAVALFAPDAVVTLPTGVLQGTDAIRAWQTELAAGNFHANVDSMESVGITVSATGSVEWDPFRSLGLESLDSTWDIGVEGGRIRTFTFTFTPEAAAAFQAALAGAQSPTEEMYEED
jgi:ketosteroid isomerase-like protein